jgi:hypothetical protein
LTFLIAAVILTLLVLFLTFRIRAKDLPEPIVPSPTHHLETRKAAIYENLRDLNFEYRVGKLSDVDYQRTKAELQTQLAGVLAEIDQILKSPAPAVKKAADPKVCPHCGAKFDKALKFCGECGKPMQVGGVA